MQALDVSVSFTTSRDDSTSTWRLGMLVLAVTVVGAGLAVLLRAGVHDGVGKVRGRDFLQFYVAGRLCWLGEADRLYQQDRFFLIQDDVAPITDQNPRYFSLYPPTIGLLFAPLSVIPYPRAVEAWWLLQVTLLIAAGRLAASMWPIASSARQHWPIVVLFYPVLLALLNGQLSPLLLLPWIGALRLTTSGRPVLAGMIWSILACKPQFLVGAVVWLLLERAGRSLLGIILGIAVQLLTVGMILGPQVWIEYGHNLRIYGQLADIYHFTPDYEHSLGGVVGNAIDHWAGGDVRPSVQFRSGLRGVQLVGSLMAFCLLAWHSWRRRSTLRPNPNHASTAILATLLMTPHLLVYDLLLLAIPLLSWWTEGRRSWAKVVYLTCLACPLYGWIGLTPTPFVLLMLLWLVVSNEPLPTPAGSADRG